MYIRECLCLFVVDIVQRCKKLVYFTVIRCLQDDEKMKGK